MIARIKAALAAARNLYFKLRAKRHDAKPGGDRREKLAKEQREAEADKKRLAKKLAFLKSHHDPKPNPDGTVTIDGKEVALWIAKWVLEARNKGLWHGYVVSGYRSPAYSTSLCEAMCGAPTCPGRCAGATSNHSGLEYPSGAVDVDVAHRDEFASAMQRLGSPLHNALGPADPNHFSASGR